MEQARGTQGVAELLSLVNNGRVPGMGEAVFAGGYQLVTRIDLVR